ncbi:CGNR zinc finger domain-containing protein [Herbiconiux solani]|uniref:CGNR zinc finger domain-containing protein n=1 Tax=Herbiconiux solani TaxID=661329 RepID=UPI0008255EE5|nr:CGNR zinc finger domain-containing protein [Herbiconiux solani]
MSDRDTADRAPGRTYSAIAGHPLLDLVNTVAWRLSSTRWDDRLIDYGDLLAWALQFGFVDAAEAEVLRTRARDHPVVAARELARVSGLREALYAATYPAAPAGRREGGAQPGAEELAAEKPAAGQLAAEQLAAEYGEAIGAGRLETAVPWSWRFDVDLSLPRRRLALAAVDLLATVDPDALGQCADDECGWVFLDTSPRHNRLWCVSADCGNRNRVRRHNARTRRSA